MRNIINIEEQDAILWMNAAGKVAENVLCF